MGKKVVLCITGSVSAYKSVDIARELIRHGAEVQAVMTDAAQKIIHPNLVEWATGKKVITELTGRIEHVLFTTGEGRADVILVAPATANTISKIASGIDDTPVTSFVSSALGSGTPILVAPAMHETMLNHIIIQENIRRLKNCGITIIDPIMEEGKAKLADEETIVEEVISTLSKKDMKGLKVLITGGATVEHIDPVRVITNMSSGKMSISLAKIAKRRGADVTLILGKITSKVPKGMRILNAYTFEEMYNNVKEVLANNKFDLVFAAAAVTDYRPSQSFQQKIQTSEYQAINLELKAVPKIVKKIKEISPNSLLVIFKAEHSVSEQELVERAAKAMRESNADFAVANDVGKESTSFGSDYNEVFVLNSSGKSKHIPLAKKDEIASKILDFVLGNDN